MVCQKDVFLKTSLLSRCAIYVRYLVLQWRLTRHLTPLQAVLDKFNAYLEAVGVDREFCIMLEHMYFDKEQREYEVWLERICKFMDQ